MLNKNSTHLKTSHSAVEKTFVCVTFIAIKWRENHGLHGTTFPLISG